MFVFSLLLALLVGAIAAMVWMVEDHSRVAMVVALAAFGYAWIAALIWQLITGDQYDRMMAEFFSAATVVTIVAFIVERHNGLADFFKSLRRRIR